ncbi:MAG: hypothetical protein OXB98_14145 [Bryobacterales bacterium]|nr:hypothetical protein [Bryobacterales bacterium]
MNGEIIAIVTVGVALAGLLVGLFAWLRQDMTHLRTELRDDIRQLADRVGRLEERVARIEHSQAKLEGLLEGLREAITGRVPN